MTVWLRADVVSIIVQQRLTLDFRFAAEVLEIAQAYALDHHNLPITVGPWEPGDEPHSYFLQHFRRHCRDGRGRVWTLVLEHRANAHYEVRWLEPEALAFSKRRNPRLLPAPRTA